MWKEIFFSFNYFADFFLLFIILFSIIKVKKNQCKEVNTIIIYCFLTFLTNLVAVLNFNKLIQVSIMYYWISFSFIHTFFILQLIKIQILSLKKYNNYKIVFYALIFLQLLFCIIDLLYSTYYSATCSNIVILLSSLFYFSLLLKSSFLFKFINHPGFILMKGILFSTSLITPIILFGNHAKSIFHGETYYVISLIGPISSTVLYFYFFKTVICFYKNLA
jgi:hypothetical protein